MSVAPETVYQFRHAGAMQSALLPLFDCLDWTKDGWFDVATMQIDGGYTRNTLNALVRHGIAQMTPCQTRIRLTENGKQLCCILFVEVTP